MSSGHKFEVISSGGERDSELYPGGVRRIVYKSAFDGKTDWALFRPGDVSKNAVVFMHGSLATGDQIFTRRDIRNFWLRRIIAGNHPLLSVNMRGTSYMSPAAERDLSDLLDYCVSSLSFGKVILLGGSGGASSAMAYACLRPDKINGVVAMGMCDIFARLDYARRNPNPALQKVSELIFESYGGTPEELPDVYRARSVLANTGKLNMPVTLTMGESDPLIPVAETRKIAAAMKDKKDFTYYEIPNGDHDSAVWVDIDLETLKIAGGYRPEDRE
jgi:pimeloyl-ACP methyl ester carboxylesterase